MALTALQIVQSALGDIGKTFPASIISDTVSEQIQLRNILYAQSRHLRNMACWPTQKRTHTFDLESGRSKYPLPPNFYSFSPFTQWDTDARLRLRGPAGDSEFTAELYGIVGGLSPVNYRVRGSDGNIAAATAGGQFQVTPTPAASGQSLAFEFYTRDLFIPPYWAALEAGITSSPAEYRFANDLILKCTVAGTTGTTAPTGAGVDGTVTWAVHTVPYETIIVNEDQSVFDDDLMVCGVKWRYLKAKGLEYNVEAQEYKVLQQSAKTRWVGGFSGYIGQNSRWQRRYGPSSPGGWSI